MALNSPRFKLLHPPHPYNYSAQKLNQLEADLVSTARMWAVDEVRAAMAHQLNDPLTALLLYLHEIKERGGHSAGTEAAPNSVREIMDKALHEAERVCGIMERMGHTFEAPVDDETAIARGRDAIAVVDPNGDLVYFYKMEDTLIASTLIAPAKARTAARFKRPTEAFFTAMQTPAGAWLSQLDPTLWGLAGRNSTDRERQSYRRHWMRRRDRQPGRHCLQGGRGAAEIERGAPC